MTTRPALLRAGMWQAPPRLSNTPQPPSSDVRCADPSGVRLPHPLGAGMPSDPAPCSRPHLSHLQRAGMRQAPCLGQEPPPGLHVLTVG